jgi:hypothetical protein
MTEEEQATLAYIKLQDDVKEMIVGVVTKELTGNANKLNVFMNGFIERTVVNAIGKAVHEELDKYKQEMIMEICLAVGRTIQVADKQGRAPLWETDPTEFGLDKAELNSHMIEGNQNAIRQQT